MIPPGNPEPEAQPSLPEGWLEHALYGGLNGQPMATWRRLAILQRERMKKSGVTYLPQMSAFLVPYLKTARSGE